VFTVLKTNKSAVFCILKAFYLYPLQIVWVKAVMYFQPNKKYNSSFIFSYHILE